MESFIIFTISNKPARNTIFKLTFPLFAAACASQEVPGEGAETLFIIVMRAPAELLLVYDVALNFAASDYNKPYALINPLYVN